MIQISPKMSLTINKEINRIKANTGLQVHSKVHSKVWAPIHDLFVDHVLRSRRVIDLVGWGIQSEVTRQGLS